jgi:hypothetical protein
MIQKCLAMLVVDFPLSGAPTLTGTHELQPVSSCVIGWAENHTRRGVVNRETQGCPVSHSSNRDRDAQFALA